LFLTVPLAAQPPQPKPVLAFSADGLAASGLTAGGTVVWYGLERRVDDYTLQIVRHAQTSAAAADGTAALALGRAAAPASLWIAVDLASGTYDVAAPDGSAPHRLPKPLTGLLPGAGGAADRLTDTRSYIEALVVRPAVGAWTFHGGDGGQDDEDGKPDGRLLLPLDRLQPLATAPAPAAKAGDKDLWFVLDPNRLEYSILKGGVAQ
jgi:hypothetical protein